MIDEPVFLAQIEDDVIDHLGEEFALQATAKLLSEAQRRFGANADTGPEITEIMMALNNAAFVAGFKVARRIHLAEMEH